MGSIILGRRPPRVVARLRRVLRRTVSRELVLLTLLSAALFLACIRFIGQGYRIDGRCMEPWVYNDDRIWGDKWSLQWRAPRRGEVVVFEHVDDEPALYLKRIIALGGETVEIRHGQVLVNGKRLPEPYMMTRAGDDHPPHTVAPGTYYVLGDNRDFSDDSRHWGDVDARRIVARAQLRFWPLRPGLQPVQASYPRGLGTRLPSP